MSSAAFAKPGNFSGSRRAFALVFVAAAALGCKFFYFIYVYAVNVFYYDQWDFLAPFFSGNTDTLGLFLRQHGPPRLGLGLISLKLLYGATHWSTRAEAFMIGISVFVAMILALRLKQELFGGISYTDVAIPLIFLTLTQYETLIGAIDPAYGGFPLLLTVVYCLVLLLRDFRLRYALLVPLNFILIYTGFGFFVGVVTLGVFALDVYRGIRRWSAIPLRYSIAGLAAAVASLAAFFIHYVFMPAVDCFDLPQGHFVSYPWFVALMFSAFLGPRQPLALVTGAGAIGVLVALLALAIHSYRLLRRSKKHHSPDIDRIHLISAVLLGYSALFAGSAALGRACLGLPNAAQAPRYSTLLIPAYLGVYFSLMLLPSLKFRNLALGLFLAVLLPGGILLPRFSGHVLADGKRAWAACYLRLENIGYCDHQTGFPIYPHPERNGMQAKLDYLKQNRLSFFYKLQ